MSLNINILIKCDRTYDIAGTPRRVEVKNYLKAALEGQVGTLAVTLIKTIKKLNDKMNEL